MKTNRNGIPILTGRDALTSNMFETQEWGYSVEEILQDAFIELGINPNRPQIAVQRSLVTDSVVPAGSSINTRPGVPTIPTFKGVRYLGKLSFPQRIKLRLQNFGHAVTKTGVYAR
jgi:hypothetical protein